MTKRKAYELGYDQGSRMKIDAETFVPTCIPPEMVKDYLRGMDHAIEDRLS